MLDNQKQIDAFKLLQGHTGSAHSVTVSNAMTTTAKTKADALTALKTPATAVTYPASISAQITQLNSFITALTNASNSYKALSATLTPYNDIEELVNMSIGFDCWVKAYGHPASTPFPLVEGLAEIAKVDGLKAKVDAFDLTAITTQMNKVNTLLTPTTTTPAGGGTATTTPGPGLSAQNIADLKAAFDAQQPTITAMIAATAQITDLNSRAAASVTQAKAAFHDAVEIALIVVLQQDPRMAGAITALVPANVLAALK